MSDQRITVAVRIRPPIERERYEPLCARKADDDQTIMIKAEETSSNTGGISSFQFDYAFDESDDQCAVYEESVQEMVDHALSGFNATVFTYGQTGSGKTYTILGAMSPDGHVSEKSGIFLRVFDDLFRYKESVKQQIHMIITLSALELYVEDVMDLLSNKKKLKLRETPEETLTMGIKTTEVTSMAEVVQNFEIANSFRSVTATKMNDTSSRSHALFFIDLFQLPVAKSAQPPQLSELLDSNGMIIPTVAPGITRSRIALVDLAGSERVKRSGVSGQGMVEAQAINKSLSTLGTVINALYTQSTHVPFREAKLTKLLKPSFVDPTSRLLLIGQVAPPSNSSFESLGTLRFCDRVKGLKAGQMMGFVDPAEEEAFLKSLRANEELAAEMRILKASYFFQPINFKALAAAKGTTVAQEQQQATAELKAGAADVVQRKEAEALRLAEAAEHRKRDAEVEAFVLQMNGLIEEYEQVAHGYKKEKKALKKFKEELDGEQEARTHDAKKAKKQRLKMEEMKAQVVASATEAAEEEGRVDAAIVAVQEEVFNGEEHGFSEKMEGPVEEATHALVESFYNHAMEQSRLYSLYVSRLVATGRERSAVRHMKLMSSTLITEGTLLYDIVAFLVDRAVDISEGAARFNAKWGWHDVDGLSQRLLCADEIYPPLVPAEFEPLDADAVPCKEEAHRVTFVSSDESDDENSHHAVESRKIRQIKEGVAPVAAAPVAAIKSNKRAFSPNNAADDEEREAEEEEEEEEDDAEGETPVPHQSDWMAATLLVNTPPQDTALNAATRQMEEAEKQRHRQERKERKKRKAKEEADRQAAATAAENVNNDKLEHSVADAFGLGAAANRGTPMENKEFEGGRIKEASSQSDTDESESDQSESVQLTRKERRNIGADIAAEGTKTKKRREAKSKANNGSTQRSTAENASGEAEPEATQSMTPAQRDARYLMKVYDSPTLVQDLIRFLRSGSTMMKHGRHGKPHARLFWVSTLHGKKRLFWMEPNSRNADRSCVDLSDVSYIQLGCFSKVFRRHPIRIDDPAFFRCFTIGMKQGGRTVDVVAETTPDYEAWVVGLAHLVGVDPSWGGKLDISKEVGIDRLTYFESSLCESNYIYPQQYLELKKRVQQIATRTLRVLEENGNDAMKAQEVLGSIHPPAVNDRGAVFLTKGELRFLMSDKFDIFRVSRVWILFQQMNLVFDDNFTPATAFGITQREG